MRSLAFLPLVMIAACNAPGSTPAGDNIAVENVAEAGAEDGVSESSGNSAMPPFAEVEGAHPTAPEPAPIPAKFRGTWAESKVACGNLEHHSRLTISGRTVRHWDFVIVGDSFSIPAPDQFALKGKIESTGAPAEAHYSINPTGEVLTDGAGGGVVLVRCA